jgi:hypothetical protein
VAPQKNARMLMWKGSSRLAQAPLSCKFENNFAAPFFLMSQLPLLSSRKPNKHRRVKFTTSELDVGRCALKVARFHPK